MNLKLKTLIFVASLSAFHNQWLNAQTNKVTKNPYKSIDSICALIKIDKDDTSKVKHLNKVSQLFSRLHNIDSAVMFGKQAISIAAKLKADDKLTKKIIAIAYNTLGNVYGQQGNSNQAINCDSQSLKLMQEIGDKDGIAQCYSRLASDYLNTGNSAKALTYYLDAMKIQEELGDQKDIAYTYVNLSNVYSTQGNYPEALKSLNSSLPILEKLKDKYAIATCLNNIGIIYYYLGNYPLTLKNYFASLKIRQEINDENGVADCYGNIGDIYMAQQNYDAAEKSILAALKLREKLKDETSISSAYLALGNIYNLKGSYEKALSNYQISLDIALKYNNKPIIAVCYSNMGAVYGFKGDYEKALKNTLASLKIHEDNHDQHGIGNSYLNIGSYYLAMSAGQGAVLKNKQIQKANEYLNKALQINLGLGTKEGISNSYIILSSLDSAKSDYKSQIQHYKLHILYRDSISNEETKRNTIQQSMTYEFELKEAVTKAAQAKKDIIAQDELKQKESERNYFIAGFGLVVVFSVLLLRGYKQKQKANAIILHQKNLVDEKQREVLASIHYAKRIQNAHLPSEKYIDKSLQQLNKN